MAHKKKKTLAQQQFIDQLIIAGLWFIFMWMLFLRIPFTGAGIISAFALTPMTLFAGAPAVVILSKLINKRHKNKDHLPPAVRGALISFIVCIFIYSLGVTDVYDIGDRFSGLTKLSHGAISATDSNTIALFAFMGALISILVAAGVGISKPARSQKRQ